MKRKETREEAVKIAYSMDVNKSFHKEVLDNHLVHFEIDDLDYDYLNKTIEDLIGHIDLINKHIIDNSKDWKINRIAKVDLAILRVAITEMLYNDTIPTSVAINEAVEISKRYSNEDSHKYINGILETVAREL